MGHSTTASGFASTAVGYGTSASNSFSTAMGQGSTASGYGSAAIGFNTIAPSYAEMALGAYNTLYAPTSTNSWVTTDRLFVIGNGTSTSSRSNAMVILKNGNVGIGISTPARKLQVVGDIFADGEIRASGNLRLGSIEELSDEGPNV